ncbi:putative FBD-associated F-box protein At5g53635 [Lolium rigidum]|uniref:putative FBD-associated F-box protein At5g53635 n=1 Tax=Lolium rigidum TaxID=89674 RepID=UPI001F5C49F1|nr:putative FBD-associated F-box protein At5g53635 [Lolium rigidum]
MDVPFGHKESQAEAEEDRLSALPDDILLNILERLYLHNLMHTSTLSRRWRHLPLLISRLVLHVDEFLQCSESRTIGKVMVSYCEATTKLLASTTSAIKDIRLSFYLADPCHLHSIGQAVGNAVQSSNIDFLEFNIWPEIRGTRCTEEHRMLFGQRFMSFLDACPNTFGSLTSITLRNLQFGEADMQTIMNTCDNLQALSLHSCMLGNTHSVLKIDAPSSQLVALEFSRCYFSQVELACLPRLARLVYDTWLSIKSPLLFGYVPRLRNIRVACALLSWQMPFTLSGCLSNTSSLSTLYLDFHDEMVWFQPEDPKKLVHAFSNLKVVHLYGIFADCDLKWTLLFLEAAPFLHSFYVNISRHICGRYKLSCADNAEKTNVMWEPSDFKHYNLNLLDIEGFQKEEKLISYIKLVMERAVTLRNIHLHYMERCERCDSINKQAAFPIMAKFHNNEGEHNLIRKLVTNGSSSSSLSSVEIIIE